MSGVLVVCHERHEGLERIARVLEAHGRLTGLVPPTPDTGDEALEALRQRRPDAVLANLGHAGRLFAAARAAGADCWLSANSDVWGVNAGLRARIVVERDATVAADIAEEIDAEFEAQANADIAAADRVLTASERMRGRLLELGVAADAITVIGQGVDVTAFEPATRDWSGRPLSVITVSRTPYAKGVDTAIEAAQRAHAASMTVVGAMPETFRLRYPDVRFPGHLDRAALGRELAAADVFVLPTLADNMPRAVLEALAAGLPVITTPESGYEGIVADGVDGFIVAAGDAEAIAARLRLLAGDGVLRQRMSAAARKLAERWSWEGFEGRVQGLR